MGNFDILSLIIVFQDSILNINKISELSQFFYLNVINVTLLFEDTTEKKATKHIKMSK